MGRSSARDQMSRSDRSLLQDLLPTNPSAIVGTEGLGETNDQHEANGGTGLCSRGQLDSLFLVRGPIVSE